MDLQQYVEEIQDQLIEVRRHLHENPELSMQEFNTTKFIREILKDTSIEWQETGMETGLIGLMHGADGPNPVLMLRGDIDALPIVEDTELPFASKNSGVMHACGHDLHTTVLIGTALVLNRLRESWKGTIKFVFQPAEEIMGGAKRMIEAGVLENPVPNHVVCLHTWPYTDAGKIGVKNGPIMAASDMFEVEITGSGGHAAHPHKSIDPIPVATDMIAAFQKIVSRNLSPLESAVITVGQIHGGSANNIIANNVTLSGTVRTLNEETRSMVKKRMEEVAEHTALASNAKATVEFQPGSPPLINDDALVLTMEQALTKHLGEANIDYLKEPSMGGEDFAFYLEHIPGMLFRLGTGTDNERTRRPLHNAGIVFDEQAIPAGVTAMSGFAIEYLNQKD
ncbi:M20 family metallopeptidase [Planococcus sp. X10-3]|uniref:M20 metallopeptidase family protein n=1 Tax=Planococcus sp. X10-3 TaxID=3061240 RepID=UPI003BAF5360